MFDGASETNIIASQQHMDKPGLPLVDKAVAFINEVANKSIYQGSMEIGNYVLTEFFNNDIKLATSRNPHKPASYRELCKREDLVIRAPALSIMVRVAAQERYFQEHGVESDKLSYTIKAELIKLSNNDEGDGEYKINLVKEIFEDKLTTRQVEEKVRLLRNRTEKQTEQQLPLKYFEMLGKYFKSEVLEKFTFDPDIVKESHKKTRELLKEKAVATKNQLQDLIYRCDALLSAIEEAEKREGTEEREEVAVAAPQQ